MLKRLRVQGFKSLQDVEARLAPMVVLFGPNAAGKSNLVEAILLLARLGTELTLSEALGPPLRGQQLEMFSLPEGGLLNVLGEDAPSERVLRLEADVRVPRGGKHTTWRYAIGVSQRAQTGTLGLADELLVELGEEGSPRDSARIERAADADTFVIRRRREAGKPRQEKAGLHHSILSNLQLSGDHYPAFDAVRGELLGWRIYYLDPRVAMRADQSPRDVDDIGPLGEALASFLFRVKHHDPRRFQAIRRALQSAIPTIQGLDVDLDPRRGTLDVQIVQDDTPISSRIVSEGTLRVLALAAIAANPWPGRLVAFEEPENGVHPRRIEVIARLLWQVMESGQQVIVTTHSPLFVAAMIRLREQASQASFLRVSRGVNGTVVSGFDPTGPLFDDATIRDGLRSPDDELLQQMLQRGWLDGA